MVTSSLAVEAPVGNDAACCLLLRRRTEGEGETGTFMHMVEWECGSEVQQDMSLLFGYSELHNSHSLPALR
jgi:hypothetical protein